MILLNGLWVNLKRYHAFSCEWEVSARLPTHNTSPRTKKAPEGASRKLIKTIYGDNRSRTGDLLHAMQALSQLSYAPV